MAIAAASQRGTHPQLTINILHAGQPQSTTNVQSGTMNHAEASSSVALCVSQVGGEGCMAWLDTPSQAKGGDKLSQHRASNTAPHQHQVCLGECQADVGLAGHGPKSKCMCTTTSALQNAWCRTSKKLTPSKHAQGSYAQGIGRELGDGPGTW